MSHVKTHSPSRAALLALATSLLASSCSNDQSPSAPTTKSPPNVLVWEVKPAPVETRRSWPATLEPLRVLEVLAPANGRLLESTIQAGDQVEAGGPMMTMSFPESEAALASVTRRDELLEREAARLESLVAGRAVSAAEAAAKRADQLETRARLRAIEALLAEGTILAPTTGMVLDTLVSPGSAVIEGTVLARIADAGSHGARFDVPNPELRHFENPGSLSIVLDVQPAESLAIGRIVRSGGLRPNTTQLELWLGPGTRIAAPAAATIIHQSSRETLLIPWSAVATEDDRTWVGQVDRDSGEVRRRPVVTGATSGTSVEVLEGLSTGDWVLRHDPRSFADGAVVTPNPTPSTTGQ